MRCTRRFGIALVLLPLLAGTAAAQGITTRTILLKSGDEQIKAFVAEPPGKGPHPAVVVIQEWWGLNDWIKENAKRLAEKGYVALAPDLYRGKVTDNPKMAAQLIKGLPKDRALRDLEAAFRMLAMMRNVNKDRIGAIGWCMGGGYALELAMHQPNLAACVICYGRVTSDKDQLKKVKAAVLGIFGEEDKGIPADGVRAFEKELKSLGEVERIHIFKDAGHGFMRPANGKTPNPAYREAQAREAWRAIDAFLDKRLQKK
jgi:carboxymethylenebutenolidase